ncbi:MAG: SOS response-associated peptidase [Gemmatimonadales bacterium]
MCGRFTLTEVPDPFAEIFRLEDLPPLERRYNIAPTQDIAVVRPRDDGTGGRREVGTTGTRRQARELSNSARREPAASGAAGRGDEETTTPDTEMSADYPLQPPTSNRKGRVGRGVNELVFLRWGLIPSWSTALEPAPLINARSESVRDKPSFAESFERRRCVVPADGYYEWKGERGSKQPYLIRLLQGKLFGMAALWDRWISPEGSPIESCAIITTESNELTRGIHDRMPVILPDGLLHDWLDPAAPSSDLLRHLVPFDSAAMEVRPVSPRVNGVEFDDPECLRESEVNLEFDL